MADFALNTEAAVVNILASVAADTGPVDNRLHGLRVGRNLVTGVAICLSVRAVKRKTGLAVIEVPSLPRAGAMAGFALDAEDALVHVLLFMAAVTVSRCGPEGRRLVTFLALDAGVAASQRKARTVVVELFYLPVTLSVAVLATIAQLPLVTLLIVVLAVA